MAVGLRLEDSPYSWLWPSRPRLWKASERIENFWCRVEELESKRLHGTLTPMAGTTSNDPSFPLKMPELRPRHPVQPRLPERAGEATKSDRILMRGVPMQQEAHDR